MKTRDEIIARYGWRDGEREQVMQEMAEREERNRVEAAATWQPPEPVAKAAPIPPPHHPLRPAMMDNFKSSNIIAAVGDVIGEERGAREKIDAEHARQIEKLQAEVGTLKLELAELRGRLIERDAAAPPVRSIRGASYG